MGVPSLKIIKNFKMVTASYETNQGLSKCRALGSSFAWTPEPTAGFLLQYHNLTETLPSGFTLSVLSKTM